MSLNDGKDDEVVLTMLLGTVTSLDASWQLASGRTRFNHFDWALDKQVPFSSLPHQWHEAPVASTASWHDENVDAVKKQSK